jgi:hypothetical protein
MLAWKYINKSAFAISAMRDYDSMKAVIGATPDRIKEQCNKATASDSISREESAVNAVTSESFRKKKAAEDIDLIKERYAKAREYMEWFLSAWTNLREQDQKILREYYMSGSIRSGASIRLQHELNYSERQIDRMRANALETFSLLLFGE